MAGRKKHSFEAVLRAMTFADIVDWAGDKIFSRGKRYVKNVQDICRVDDNGLAAWVVGGDDYATKVHLYADGDHVCFCTCPCSFEPCKHAVAVVLAAVERLRQGSSVPPIEKNSELYEAIFDDDGWADETEPDMPDGDVDNRQLRAVLEDRSREELITIITGLAERHPEIGRALSEDAQIAGGKIDGVVRALRKEIVRLTEEHVWYDYWRDRGNLPDYSHVCEKFESLVAAGCHDVVVELGTELFKRGNEQLGQSNDEGDIAMAIGECMAEVLNALPQSSLTPPQQLLWLIDRLMEDEFCIFDMADDIFKRRSYTKTNWRTVAETLESRLDSIPKTRSGNFSESYRRGQLVDWVLKALREGGMDDKIIPLLEREAEPCCKHVDLVDALLVAGNREKARECCIRGFKATSKNACGVANELWERLRKMAVKEKKYDLAAAHRAQMFFKTPSLRTYDDLRKDASKAKCWDIVRPAVLEYLETGRRPDIKTAKNSPQHRWNLPMPEITIPPKEVAAFHKSFPLSDLLLEIAISEKRNDDAVALHQRRAAKQNPWERHSTLDEKLAVAVSKSHPQTALDIRWEMADQLIAQVKPKAYVEAARHLRAMRGIYKTEQRLADWDALMAGLRKKHKAKRRLIEVLDRLENKKLID